ADIVGSQTAGNLLPALVVPGQVRADDLPTVAGIRGHVDVLAADVNTVVIVGGDEDGKLPVKTAFDLRGGRSGSKLGPHFHVDGLMVALIEDGHNAADAAGAAGSGPDDVAVHRIGRRKTALAA